NFIGGLVGDSSNIGTLREAIEWANSSSNPLVPNSTPNVVMFDTTGVFSTPQTITLAINGSFTFLRLYNTNVPETIMGPGVTGPSALTLNGNNSNVVFSINELVTASISGMTITQGRSGFNGGAIYNSGTLALNNVTISNSYAPNYAGGIINFGKLTITNSTISGNSAHNGAAGIFNEATLTISNSILSGNHTPGNVSAIDQFLAVASTTIANSTITGNTSGAFGTVSGQGGGTITLLSVTLANNLGGGGLFNNGVTFSTRNTILSGNAGGDVMGNIGSQGHNLIGNSAGGSGFAASDILNMNPRLLAPANNGGPTQTMALGFALPGDPSFPNNPAVDVGDNNGAAATDQRDSTFARIINGVIDIGAFEDQIVSTAPANQAAVEGTALSVNLASFTDQAPLSSYTVTILWGDGSSSTLTLNSQGAIPSQMHTFTDEGSYAVTVQLSDADGDTGQKTFTVTVSNPNVVATGSFAFSASEGTASAAQTVATFTDPAGPETLSDYSASITWGDGGPATVGNLSQSGTTFTVQGSHTYAEEGTYTITVTINHETTTAQTVTSTATVSNPPVAASGGFSFSAVEGSGFTAQKVATFTDPGGPETLSDYSASITWGDGSAATTGSISLPGGSTAFTVTGSHTYAEEGAYTITVTIGHETTAAQTASTIVTVSNPPVTASGGFAFSAAEGAALGTQMVATFTDPAGPETLSDYTVSINWGDSTAATAGNIVLLSGSTTFSVTGSHTYAEEGTYTITVTVGHENTTPQTATSTATVSDPNVIATGGSAFSASEGSLSVTQMVATFTDPGGAEANDGTHYSATINWGDNTSTQTGTISFSGSTFTVSGNHTYGDEGTYTITVTINHESTAPQSVTGAASVANPNVVASGGFAFSAAEGTALGTQMVATFTDPGGPETLSDYSATITWGDGTAATAGTITLLGTTFTVSGTHAYADEGAFTITATISHESTTPQTVTATATISNPNVVANGGFSVSAAEGSASSSQTVATFTDPGGPEAPADYSASISWSDGTAATAGTITLSGTTFTVSASHSYGEEGAYAITVTISHENTTAQTVSSTATVSDPALVGTAVAVSVTAGSPLFSQAVATFTDPGGAEPNASDNTGTIANHYKIVSINWGDGTALDTTTGVLSYTGGAGSKTAAFTVSGNHTYAANGTYTLVVNISHEGVTTPVSETFSVGSLGLFFQGNVQTKTSGFWAGIVGQELLRRFGLTAGGQTLGQWLASTFPKLYGGAGGAVNLGSFTNSQIAIYYLGLFHQFNTNMLDASVLSAALYEFATTLSLGGPVAGTPPYSLTVNTFGMGAYSFNVGFNGAAFGVPNFTVLDVFQILQAANTFASGGEPWGTNSMLRNEGLSVFRPINGDTQQP
ncbi:MAG TPA: choice-of-anchor Q domain-containing protein, partial [Gemmataceae bacterium]|nr:choice-of-anchor Q domain-containing protein [Gemmataceae bacterium]